MIIYVYIIIYICDNICIYDYICICIYDYICICIYDYIYMHNMYNIIYI